MKKYIVLALTLLGSSAAYAQVATEGEMLAFCSRQTYDSDKRACLAIVQNKLFEVGAVQFCSRQTYDSEKRTCLTVIANREYSQDILRFCGTQTYDSDKLNCLRNAPSNPIYTTPPSECKVRNLSGRIDAALQAVRRGESRRAEYILEDIQRELGY